ncbi:diacylglycerol kinase catalytic region [Chthoniobacter flavus Ellin428]|uniref:Diacylglycerol kinase catalytic region n=2 Tax=Chthoniobacter flavus TaxID=191863 RepID=B4D2P1_9BACT|nr:diacylglycerol kinase catalytic region [Chthoniobacter flavus Ellin428]TCO90393.1 YegS/Rv2252/BmrU family lipid kinase [Chthoniobacter flavus]
MRATAAPGDARAVAEAAVKEGFATIVAAGGDGTVNEVVNGIVGSDVSLGILPVGTMNVFAAELGLPGDLDEAWAIIQAGRTRRVDLLRANQQYFVQLAGVGLDAQVVQATSWNFKKNFGPLSYLISAAQIAAQKPPRLYVEADDQVREGSFVLIGNGRYYGGPLAFFKEARIDDGKLDVLIFKNLAYLDIARYVTNVFIGKHTGLPDVEYFQTKKASVRSDEDVPVEVDGEVVGALPVTFRISSRKLKVVVPVGRDN